MADGAGQQVEPPADLVELGRIVGAYGVRGWVKVEPYSAQGGVLLAANTWWLGSGSGLRAQPVAKSRPQGATVVAQFAGVDDRDQALRFRGCSVSVSRSAFPAADADEYYWVDLIGCLAYGVDDTPQAGQVLLGRVVEVLDNSAHGVLRIERLSVSEGADPVPLLDAKGRAQELLVPFVAAHVHTVDLPAKRIDTNWPAAF